MSTYIVLCAFILFINSVREEMDYISLRPNQLSFMRIYNLSVTVVGC